MDDFPLGSTWTGNLRAAAQRSRRLIPLYSQDYWQSGACVEEFDSFWRQHLMNGTTRFLLPLEIQPCAVPDMHKMLLWKPIHALSRAEARAAILKVLEGITPVASILCTEPEPPFPATNNSPVLAVEWPESAPDLKWHLANHDEARLAFAELVTRSSKFRFLGIRGNSETGKSHVTMQFLTNAQRRISVCRCARFDFKGSDQIDQSLATFVQHLDVPLPPASSSLSERFGRILQNLAQRQQPSLLIFDTYEDAGDADRWVLDSLLTSLHRHPWLRVVVAGQVIPVCHGKPWEEDSQVLQFGRPDPEHWLAYAQANKRTISLSTLDEVFKLTNGKASILAQLCGPHI
jgi:hypothetical protein